MVAVTTRKAQKLGLDNLEAREMDMQALAFRTRRSTPRPAASA